MKTVKQKPRANDQKKKKRRGMKYPALIVTHPKASFL